WKESGAARGPIPGKSINNPMILALQLASPQEQGRKPRTSPSDWPTLITLHPSASSELVIRKITYGEQISVTEATELPQARFCILLRPAPLLFCWIMPKKQTAAIALSV